MNNRIAAIKRTVSVRQVAENHGIRLQADGPERFKGLCPFHEEKDPSFKLFLDSNRWKCFGCDRGGDVLDLQQALGAQTLPEALDALDPQPIASSLGTVEHFEPVPWGSLQNRYPFQGASAVFDYGTFQVVRREGKDGQRKFFQVRATHRGVVLGIREGTYTRQRTWWRPGEGRETVDLPAVDPILWPRELFRGILEQRSAGFTVKPLRIYLTEGETDCLALEALGLPATCNPGGAGNFTAAMAQELADLEVVRFQDTDKAGTAGAVHCVKLLESHAARVRLVPTLGDRKGYDVRDWIEERRKLGHTSEAIRDELMMVVEDAPILSEKAALLEVRMAEFLALDLPEPSPILEPVLLESNLAMVYGRRGVGKSQWGLSVGLAAAMGTEVFGWKALHPVPTVYIDGEMLAHELQKRVRALSAGLSPAESPKAPPPFWVVSKTLLFSKGGRLHCLTTEEGQKSIEQIIKRTGARLVILDNLSSLVLTGGENDGQDWIPIQEWLIRLRSEGVAVLMVHHPGKGGDQRGTSRREDVLDLVVKLRPPEGWDASQGCRMNVEFTKARHYLGPAGAPFATELVKDHERLLWSTESTRQERDQTILEMSREGKGERTIAKLIGVSKTTVHRVLCKAREEAAL